MRHSHLSDIAHELQRGTFANHPKDDLEFMRTQCLPYLNETGHTERTASRCIEAIDIAIARIEAAEAEERARARHLELSGQTTDHHRASMRVSVRTFWVAVLTLIVSLAGVAIASFSILQQRQPPRPSLESTNSTATLTIGLPKQEPAAEAESQQPPGLTNIAPN